MISALQQDLFKLRETLQQTKQHPALAAGEAGKATPAAHLVRSHIVNIPISVLRGSQVAACRCYNFIVIRDATSRLHHHQKSNSAATDSGPEPAFHRASPTTQLANSHFFAGQTLATSIAAGMRVHTKVPPKPVPSHEPTLLGSVDEKVDTDI